jgi:hypothetical protein
VAVELILLFGCEVEGVECVVDTGSVKGTGLRVEGSKGAVDAAGFLLSLGCFALGLGGKRSLLFAQEGFLLSLLARGFGCLFSGGFPRRQSIICSLH